MPAQHLLIINKPKYLRVYSLSTQSLSPIYHSNISREIKPKALKYKSKFTHPNHNSKVWGKAIQQSCTASRHHRCYFGTGITSLINAHELRSTLCSMLKNCCCLHHFDASAQAVQCVYGGHGLSLANLLHFLSGTSPEVEDNHELKGVGVQ